MGEGGYLLDNAAPEAAQRFDALSAAFDPVTFRHLAALGVDEGWRCLEIGAGGGSVARWLADRAGETGSVLATDLDTRWLHTGGRSNLEARRHDIVTDDLPAGAFDLVHARLVLVHIAERDHVIPRLVEGLAPGGWLVLEEFDTIVPQILDPVTDDDHVFNRVSEAFIAAIHARGADAAYARTLPRRFRQAGLSDIGAAGHLEFLTAGSPAAALQHANIDQIGPVLVESGAVSASEVETYRRLLDTPGFVANMPLFLSAWGRKPQTFRR